MCSSGLAPAPAPASAPAPALAPVPPAPALAAPPPSPARMLPLSGVSSPVIIFSSVLFPHPLGPMSATISLGRILQVKSDITLRVPAPRLCPAPAPRRAAFSPAREKLLHSPVICSAPPPPLPSRRPPRRRAAPLRPRYRWSRQSGSA